MQYESCAGMVQAIKDHIAASVDNGWLAKIVHDVMGFTTKNPIELLEHLESWGVKLDFTNTQKIKQERDVPWDINEHIVAYFKQVDQSVKLLDRTKIAYRRYRKAGIENSKLMVIKNMGHRNPDRHDFARAVLYLDSR